MKRCMPVVTTPSSSVGLNDLAKRPNWRRSFFMPVGTGNSPTYRKIEPEALLRLECSLPIRAGVVQWQNFCFPSR